MKIVTGSVAVLVLLTLGGCCRLTSHLENRFGDVVDHIGLHEPVLDDWYHPGLDPLRIGKPDWCQCSLNRLLCPRACECYSYGSACGQHHDCLHHECDGCGEEYVDESASDGGAQPDGGAQH